MTQAWPPKPKLLYAFQGTGNGHSSRANEIVPLLKKWADVKVACSGLNRQLELDFSIDYQWEGIGFEYNTEGGLDYWATIRKFKARRFIEDTQNLDLKAFDLIINDFEPVTAWAARRQKAAILGMGHQASFYSPNAPRPSKKNYLAEWIFKYYAPAKEVLGFHFDQYDQYIYPPVIREKVRSLELKDGKGFVCYLPAYHDEEIYQTLSAVSNKEFRVFSKLVTKPCQRRNIVFEPISGDKFLEAMAQSEGVICSAGFETPAEAMFLKKKLLVVPIKGQYEQYCNAQALKDKGVTVIKSLKKSNIPLLVDWIYEGEDTELLVLEDLEQFLKKELLKRLNLSSARFHIERK